MREGRKEEGGWSWKDVWVGDRGSGEGGKEGLATNADDGDALSENANEGRKVAFCSVKPHSLISI